MKMAFFWSVSFSDSWRHQFVCHPKWSDHLDGQRDADTDLQWPRGNSGRQHTGTLTSQVLYWDVLQSYQGLQYTGELFYLCMKLLRHIRGCNTQVNHFLSCMKLFSQIRGCNTQVNHFLPCMKLFSQIRGCSTQMNHFLCCMKLFGQIRGCRTQVSRFLCCRLKVFTYSRGCNT